MKRSHFIETIRSNRAELDSVIAPLKDEQLLEPGASGDMSVKDVLAHVAWFESEMIGLLHQRALAGSDLWNLPTDERNAVIYRLNRQRSLADIRQEAKQVFHQLLKELEGLDEAALDDSGRFQNMPEDWSPRQLLAENTSEHYQHHLADIQAWLKSIS